MIDEVQTIADSEIGNETRSCHDSCGNSRLEYRACLEVPDPQPQKECDQTGLRRDLK